MSRDKQIEEMAKQLYGNFGLSMPTARNVATYLTEKKGYRKASEDAGKIIKDLVNFADDNKKEILVYGHGVWFINLDDLTEFIAELKEEYTESEKDK